MGHTVVIPLVLRDGRVCTGARTAGWGLVVN